MDDIDKTMSDTESRLSNLDDRIDETGARLKLLKGKLVSDIAMHSYTLVKLLKTGYVREVHSSASRRFTLADGSSLDGALIWADDRLPKGAIFWRIPAPPLSVEGFWSKPVENDVWFGHIDLLPNLSWSALDFPKDRYNWTELIRKQNDLSRTQYSFIRPVASAAEFCTGDLEGVVLGARAFDGKADQ